MKLSLVVMAAGKQEGKVLEIKVPQFVIGRDPDCQLRPASPMISKRHCALIQKDGKIYIKDFGSTNGSFVNDQPVQKAAVQLKDGDRLKIGPLVFAVRLQADSAVVATEAAPTPKTTPAASAPQPAASAKPVQPSTKPAVKAPVKPAAANKPQPASVGAQANAGSTPTPPPTNGSASDADEDIAALLLSGTDDETVSDGPAAKDIPQGTTVFELPIPKSEGGETDKSAESKDKPKEPPKQQESNSAVAAAILEKLRKRPRT
jgi:predicted component of type VI protein secretion system